MKAIIVLIVILMIAAGCLVQHPQMTASQALALANESTKCGSIGDLTGSYVRNNATSTWWFDLNAIKPGCSPACVVYEGNGTTDVNWRCTGAK
jgi:hypothetical protein